MEIYTGNYANLKKYLAAGLFPISISLTAKFFNGVFYRPLNPDWSYKNDPEETYTPKFKEKLNSLSKEKVINDLKNISNGKNVVLLCHEKFGDFCHRHLVNEWIGGKGEFGQKSNNIQLMLL